MRVIVTQETNSMKVKLNSTVQGLSFELSLQAGGPDENILFAELKVIQGHDTGNLDEEINRLSVGFLSQDDPNGTKEGKVNVFRLNLS